MKRRPLPCCAVLAVLLLYFLFLRRTGRSPNEPYGKILIGEY